MTAGPLLRLEIFMNLSSSNASRSNFFNFVRGWFALWAQTKLSEKTFWVLTSFDLGIIGSTAKFNSLVARECTISFLAV